ncbi:protein disulfide isomerase NosL family protein [Psychromonas ingrahamii 37]|uniref:Protein disulfide isomerase NosL family protein n=1 Tax=Psychromonas ingrahamii (strain DSM 17664 / CCUG 51855 / 37) TaxID=357804 RepID=A1SUS6_PSYIN|nr:nitrous oxide reductase accessory protein NosL [Psychromonas ingrahamii]ABM03241.1 protein disulfide isomerase NosL family protein [Psychromonas ingrahamii 37]
MNCFFNYKSVLAFGLLAVLLGCSEAEPQKKMLKQVAAIENADECHLCGMIISKFPGPKGELYQKKSEDIAKFCSTRDLFGYLLQPENQRQVKQVFVHDMSKTPWGKTDDQYFIDAKTAWYVVDSSKKGAMGKTLASFSLQGDAQAFSREYGGKVYSFDEISIDML